MTRFKPTLLFTAALALVLILSACGGQNAPVADNAAPQEPTSNGGTGAEAKEAAPTQPAEEPADEEPPAEVQPAEDEQAEAEQPVEAAGISFSAEIEPILQSRCINCHGGERIEGELVMLSYAELLAGGESGPVIIPGDADSSYLAELILEQKMPKRGPKLTRSRPS